ncbi:hypothetical protein COBT_000729, partial [Conglomerata obtusa]
IEPCAANHYDLWEIRQEKFGYAILKSTNGLTIIKNTLSVALFRRDRTQLFDFSPIPNYVKCLDKLAKSFIKKGSILQKDEFHASDALKNLKISIHLLSEDDSEIDDDFIVTKIKEKTNFKTFSTQELTNIDKSEKVAKVLKKLWDRDYNKKWWQRAFDWLKGAFCKD